MTGVISMCAIWWKKYQKLYTVLSSLGVVFLMGIFVNYLSSVYFCHLMCVCCILCVFVVSYMYLLYLMCICCTIGVLMFLLQMPDCRLEVSIWEVLRPATSTQVFLISLCIQAIAEMVPKFPSCYYMTLMQPSRLKFPIYFFFHMYM